MKNIKKPESIVSLFFGLAGGSWAIFAVLWFVALTRIIHFSDAASPIIFFFYYLAWVLGALGLLAWVFTKSKKRKVLNLIAATLLLIAALIIYQVHAHQITRQALQDCLDRSRDPTYTANNPSFAAEYRENCYSQYNQ